MMIELYDPTLHGLLVKEAGRGNRDVVVLAETTYVDDDHIDNDFYLSLIATEHGYYYLSKRCERNGDDRFVMFESETEAREAYEAELRF